jgi:hypothetical protein
MARRHVASSVVMTRDSNQAASLDIMSRVRTKLGLLIGCYSANSDGLLPYFALQFTFVALALMQWLLLALTGCTASRKFVGKIVDISPET